jgi:hypothetical protein
MFFIHDASEYVEKFPHGVIRAILSSTTQLSLMNLQMAFFVVLLLSPLVSTAQQSKIERAFTASTLADARIGFMSRYGILPKDCDPISGRWVCSELDVSDATPISEPGAPPTVASALEACTAYGATLSDAQTEFSAQCPWRVRETCNSLTTGGWACSTASIASSINAEDTPNIFSQETIPPPPPLILLTAENSVCIAYGQTLADAQTEFSAECPWRTRQTCDPSSAGGWVCSTASIDTSTNALSLLIEPVADTSTTTPSANSPLQLDAESVAYNSSLWSASENGLVYTGPNRYLLASRNDDANLVFNFMIPTPGAYRFTMRSRAGAGNDASEPPNDIWLKAPGEEWLKVYMLRDGSWQIDAIGEHNGTHSREFNTYEFGAGALQLIVSGRSQGHILDWVALESQDTQATGSSMVSGTGVMNTTYQPGDLLVIAHDSGPDTDDMQAIVANRMIMDAYPAVSYLLIGATQGHSWTNPTSGSESHTQSLFPDWINAKASTSGTTSFDGTSVIKVAEAIEQTLTSGGTVHIAEGGPSDFTAEVIRLLQSRGVQASNLKRMRVVQHSAGSGAWNEEQTSGTNMALVKSAATWVPIANGNVGGNATADFQESASSSMCQRFMKSALSTRYALQWAWAYSKIDDTRKCDQSDSVELLHILNDTGTQTFDQFTSRYL